MTSPSSKIEYSKAQLEEMAVTVDYWWHSIDLADEAVTKGFKTPETLQYELESLRLPDLRDKTVLDIGAWDGFFSFEAERRGAKRVVALDHYVWSFDIAKHGQQYWREGEVAPPAQETPSWQPDKLSGK